MKNKALKYIIVYILELILLGLIYYISLPALNFQSSELWMLLAFVLLLALLPFGFKAKSTEILEKGAKKKKSASTGSPILNFILDHLIEDREHKEIKPRKLLFVVLIPIAVLLVGQIVSSTFFNATRYAAIIDVTEANFSEDMPESDTVTNIALMDSETAAIVGNRTLGSLSHVVSQYEISGKYTQINYKYTPKKVSNLEYAGFFKWLGNRDAGIPGYVMVDPVHNTAEYLELSSPMVYVESGFFGDDLMRKLRFDYPTKIFGTVRFEIDDEGTPIYIVPCMKARVGLFGAFDVGEVILFNPCTGESEIYAVSETPTWIDAVYDGDLATEKYNWKGMYSGGFWNSIIGNRDCKITTDDYGYIVIGDDVWYFTGVTSVNSDQSNIGFIISNARTGEYKFYPVIGAEEHSAMGAAEGEVQEKSYVASFPVLINVEGKATYIMVLKDAGGLVKLYALVNVEKYSLVATGSNQEEAMSAYKALLREEGIITDEGGEEDTDGALTATVTVEDKTVYTVGGESVIYLTVTVDGEQILLEKYFRDDKSLHFVSVGDTLTVTYLATESSKVFTLVSYTK